MKEDMGIELKDMLETIFEHAGEWFQVIRATEHFRVEGVRQHEKVTRRSYIELRPTEIIQVDDVLVSDLTGEKFSVTEVGRDVTMGQFYALKAFYKTQFETDQEKKVTASNSPVFNIGTAHGSIIGNQQTATIHNKFDFAALDAQIDKQGGTDAAELKAMIGEIRDTLTKNEHVPGGVLSRFSAVMERHAWIAEPVSHILLLWSLGRLGVPLA